MRLLGLDLGTKTLGIAISDVTNTIASPLITLRIKDEDYFSVISQLKKIIIEENIKLIVLGHPLNMNNTIGTRALETEKFKMLLEDNLDVSVVLHDERCTSIEATNYMLEADLSRKKRKQKIDSLAASIILQSYLDIRKGR